MKKSLLFAFLLMGGIAGAQTISFTDVNLKSKLLDTGSWPGSCWNQNGDVIQADANNNGEIEIDEAAAVYGLNISGAYISSLAGLEAFVNVEWIQFGNNQVSSFNASIFPNLKNLMCGANPLVTLDVTNATQLENLECEYSQLTSLNVAGMSTLKYIRCSGNPLATVDLSGLAALEEFISGEGTPFTSLNFQDNINLKAVVVNQSLITSLDLSNCPQITYIGCSENSLLETINLHNGGAMLDSFECSFANNPNLNFICVDEGEETLVADCNWGDSVPPPMSSVCSLGTDDFIVDSFRAYPNPSSGIVTIDTDGNIDSLQLIDAQGRVLENVYVNSESVSLDLSARASGIYFIKIGAGEGVKVQKLIKD